MVEINKPTEQFNAKVFNEFCEKYGLSFPKSFVEYLTVNNTGELESNIVQSYEDFSVRYFLGTSSESYNNIEETYLCFIDRIPHNCVPIAEDYCGNLACLSLNDDTYGKIYFWDHETMDVDEGEVCEYSVNDMPLLADSFTDFLDNIVEYDFAAEIEQDSGGTGFNKLVNKIKNFFGKSN